VYRRHQDIKRGGQYILKRVVRGLGILIWSIFKIDFAIVGTEMIELAVIDHAYRMVFVKGYSANRIAYHNEPPYQVVVAYISFPEYKGQRVMLERITNNPW
jgi:hypothetical protein